MSHAGVSMPLAAMVVMMMAQMSLVEAFAPALQLHSRAAHGTQTNFNMGTFFQLRHSKTHARRLQFAQLSMQSDDSSEKKSPDANKGSITLDKVMENMKDGTPGERGELYVGLQFLLVFLVFNAPAFEETFESLSLIAGLATVAFGLAIGGVGVLDLGDSLTPWPKPTSKNELQTTGSFSLARHPIYGGLLIGCFGLSLVSLSFPRLFFTIILFLVLDVKASLEEKWLAEVHPSYTEYQASTPKLFPTDPTKIAALVQQVSESFK